MSFPRINRIVGFEVNGVPDSINLLLAFNDATKKFDWIPVPQVPQGEIYVTQGGSQNVDQTFRAINQFDTEGTSRLMNLDTSNGNIFAILAGDYVVTSIISITSTGNNRVITIQVFVDGIAQPSARSQHKIGTGGDVVNMSVSGIVQCNANSLIDVRITQDAGTDSTTFVEGNLAAVLL